MKTKGKHAPQGIGKYEENSVENMHSDVRV